MSGNGEQEEGIEDNSMGFYEPSFVLLAIDTHPSMFVKINDNLSTFEICLRACYEIANSLLLIHNRRNWSPFGIILANTDDKKSTFLDLNTNMIDMVKMLKKVNDYELCDLIDNYQRNDSKSFDLGGFFLSCKKKFKDIKTEYYEKIIIYLTNDDNPIVDDKNLRFTALNEAKNFVPNDIVFEMVTMKKDFNYSLFYNELLSLISSSNEDNTNDIIEQFIEDEDGMIEKLTNAIILRYYQRRLQFYIDKDDKERFLRVIQKNYVSSTNLFNNYFTTNTGKPVKKLTVSEIDDEENYTLDYMGGNINFTLSEYEDIHSTDLPIGYTLIYVTKRVTDIGFVLSNPMVLEADPKEDLPYFVDFWKYCIDQNSVLVCARKLTKSDKIRFVELIPKCVNNKTAFLVKHIPFASEIEYPPEYINSLNDININNENTQDELRCVNELIDSLTWEYQPEMFPCMTYTKKENYIKTKLLDEDEDNEVLNDVVINKEVINERIAEIVDKFNVVFEQNQAQSSTKQKSTSGTRKSSKKTK